MARNEALGSKPLWSKVSTDRMASVLFTTPCCRWVRPPFITVEKRSCSRRPTEAAGWLYLSGPRWSAVATMPACRRQPTGPDARSITCVGATGLLVLPRAARIAATVNSDRPRGK